MGYRVRTPDGELGYPTLLDVEKAYVQGLVAPDDEVLEDGHSTWRKASSIPALARARPASTALKKRMQALGVVIVVLMGTCALMLLASGSPGRQGLGLLLALATAMVFTRVTSKAFRRPGLPKD